MTWRGLVHVIQIFLGRTGRTPWVNHGTAFILFILVTT